MVDEQNLTPIYDSWPQLQMANRASGPSAFALLYAFLISMRQVMWSDPLGGTCYRRGLAHAEAALPLQLSTPLRNLLRFRHGLTIVGHCKYGGHKFKTYARWATVDTEDTVDVQTYLQS